MAQEANTFYKKLSADLACKGKLECSVVLGRSRCCISFASLRSAIMAIRGSRNTHRYDRQSWPFKALEALIATIGNYGHSRL